MNQPTHQSKAPTAFQPYVMQFVHPSINPILTQSFLTPPTLLIREKNKSTHYICIYLHLANLVTSLVKAIYDIQCHIENDNMTH